MRLDIEETENICGLVGDIATKNILISVSLFELVKKQSVSSYAALIKLSFSLRLIHIFADNVVELFILKIHV